MTRSSIARILGARGGQARAARLSPADRVRIAALGGRARRAAIEAARRVDANFGYVAALDALRPPPAVTRVTTVTAPLPGARARTT